MKHLRKFNESHSGDITTRDYYKEINKMEDDARSDLENLISVCIEKGIFKEDSDGYYELPPIGIRLPWSSEELAVNWYVKEGGTVGKTTVPKGGYILGEYNNNDYDAFVEELEFFSVIDFVEELKGLIKNS